jgi:hypothetical protein
VKIPLPQGTYLLEVAAYAIYPGSTPESLLDPAKSRGTRHPGVLVKIALNP